MKHAIQNIHFVGIGGAGMSGIAEVLHNLGYRVSGSDLSSSAVLQRLQSLGIHTFVGHAAEHIGHADVVVTSTAVQGSNPEVVAAREKKIPVVPRALMLAELMRFKQGIAIAGAHGKTTTTSLLAFLLQAGGRDPGFLVGGVAEDFGTSARLGSGAEFVVEADEYDTAFFDKRSKFVHYRPMVAVLNNLEYDHADIFPDLAAIQRQFHHLVRTVPRAGRLVVNGADAHLAQVLAMGCWTAVETFGLDGEPVATPRAGGGAGFDWSARLLVADGSAFAVLRGGAEVAQVRWPLLGRHNVMNALAALAAAHAVGVDPARVAPALAGFRSVKRRLERLGTPAGITVYDDFAHHPTAIRTTLEGLRAKVGDARVVVAMEPRSNSMRLGAHAEALAPSLDLADVVVFLHRPELAWDAARVMEAVRGQALAVPDTDGLLATLQGLVHAGDHVVFMSNGGFDAAPRRFVAILEQRG